MKPFLDEHFLLDSGTAQRLYHDYAQQVPVIDYHNHLSPQLIAEDHCFENLTQAWLYGDHYKWRAMRTNGVEESYCTGTRSDAAKFEAWAATVPYTWRNPLYHWTHLELQRYFSVHDLLSPATAKPIYDTCSAMLRTPEYSVRHLLRKMKVQVLCTTDDPTDTLIFHEQMAADAGMEIQVRPTFRPDKAMQVSDPVAFNAWVDRLQQVSNIAIHHFDDYFLALQQRHDYFSAMGCMAADHGLADVPAEPCPYSAMQFIFSKIRSGRPLDEEEQLQFASGMLLEFAKMHYAKGWVMQLHIGAMRNNNTRMLQLLGPDTGWDSIGNSINAASLARFLDTLDAQQMLPKTILYNLNPADNAMMATMAGNFNDGSFPGKVQWGSAWWFLDQKNGMEQQLNTLSDMGLLSRFIGMLTDSRSFLSFPRHEYFRRILCNLLGTDMEQGHLPHDIGWAGQLVQDICYNNARRYFNLDAEQR